MNKIRGLVVGVLLAVWCFPALSSAKALPPESTPPPAFAATGTTATDTTPKGTSAASTTDTQSTGLAQREQQAPNLQDFKGGAAIVFIGSGTVLVLVIVLLILLI
jgi:hypothetical protein